MARNYDGQGTFALQLSEFKIKALAAAEKTVEGTILGLAESVINNSPVLTGFFRYQWQFSMDAPITETLDYPGTADEKKGLFIVAAGVPYRRIVRQVEQFELGRTAYLMNPTDYGIPLEYGYSQKAPQGMVRIALENLDQIIKEAAAKAQLTE